MSEIVLHNMSEYPLVIRRVLMSEDLRAPRGLMTRDAGFMTVTLLDPRGGMPLGMGRGLKPAIGAVEAAQLIAGFSNPELVLRLAPQFGRYVEYDDDRPLFWGSYGIRIGMQASHQIKKMTDDPLTRQAVITLWDPWRDNVAGKKDYPCTIALQFSISDGLLDMNTIMRSNDVWLGFPYDVFQFTQLQASVARAMGTEPGIYRHTALSMHMYQRDEAAVREFLATYNANSRDLRASYRDRWQPDGIGRPGDNFSTIMDRGLTLLDDRPLVNPTKSEEWYRDQLHGARATA